MLEKVGIKDENTLELWQELGLFMLRPKDKDGKIGATFLPAR